MSDEYEKLDLPEISFWMNGANAQALCKAAQLWFQRLGDAAIWPLRQCDAMTCSVTVLNLLAWQRGISRYPDEPDRLYRLRVAHAYANGRDAGSTAGWQGIFERLELLNPNELALEERIHGQDWDRVGIFLSDQRLAELQDILFWIMIPEYGRTCRRYTLVSRSVSQTIMGVGVFDNDYSTYEARVPQDFTATFIPRPDFFFFHNDHCTCEAQLPVQFSGGFTASTEIFDNDHSTVEAIWQ